MPSWWSSRPPGQRDAAQWLLDASKGAAAGEEVNGSAANQAGGLKPLDHIQPEHERTQEILDANTAQATDERLAGRAGAAGGEHINGTQIQ